MIQTSYEDNRIRILRRLNGLGKELLILLMNLLLFFLNPGKSLFLCLAQSFTFISVLCLDNLSHIGIL